MQSKSKLAIAGVAGLAIISGASYYFFKKRQANLKNPKYILGQLRKSLFGSKIAPFNEIMSTFTASNNLRLGSYLLELMSNGTETREIKSRICKKDLKGRYFYECLDCSANSKFHSKDLQERECQDNYSHQICEDCFDQEIHKGHKYKLIQGIYDGRCDCGYSTLVKESSFCSKHCGFSSLRKEYDEQLAEDKKELIKGYFKDLFYLLIDGQSDLIYSKMKQQKVSDFEKIKSEQLFVSYNILFTLIADQINELLDLNHQLIYAFTTILKEPFELPVRYKVGQEKFEVLEKSEVNSKQSILDYIFVFQSSLNEKSLEKLHYQLELLSSADTSFLQYMSTCFMRNINYAITVEKKKDHYGKEFEEFTMSSLSVPCNNAYGDVEFIHQQVIENQQDQIFILKLIKETMNKMTFASENEFWLLQVMFTFVSNVVHSAKTLQEFDYLEEFLELYLDIQYLCLQKTILMKTPKMDIMTFLRINFQVINGVLSIQQMISTFLFNITSYAITDLSVEKKELVLQILCRRYAKEIEGLYERNVKQQKEMKQDLGYIGLSIAYNIINIVVISEGREITKENVINAIKKNFKFNNEEEFYSFLNKIAEILHLNVLTYSKDTNGFLMVEFSQLMMSHPQLQDLLGYIWSSLLEGEYSIYDSNTLAFQLVSIAQKKEDTQLYKFAKNPLYYNDKMMRYVYNWKQMYVINHTLLLDQTPLINIDRKLKNILSKDNNDVQQKIETATKQLIRFSQRWLETKKFSQLFESVSQAISDKYLILNTMKQLGGYDKEKDSLEIQPSEKAELCSIQNGRYLLNISAANFSCEFSPLSYLSPNINIFKNLYKYQQDFMVECLFDFEILKNIDQETVDELYKKFNEIDILFFFWVELIKLAEKEPEFFNSTQTKMILDFKNQLYTKEIYATLKPVFLKIETIINETQKPLCFLLRDQLEEYEKNEKLL